MHLKDRTKIAKDAKQERMFVVWIEHLLLPPPDEKAPHHKYPGARQRLRGGGVVLMLLQQHEQWSRGAAAKSDGIACQPIKYLS